MDTCAGLVRLDRLALTTSTSPWECRLAPRAPSAVPKPSSIRVASEPALWWYRGHL